MDPDQLAQKPADLALHYLHNKMYLGLKVKFKGKSDKLKLMNARMNS